MDEPVNEADIKTIKDCGESPSLMEPMLLGEGSRHRPALTELAFELAQRSAGLRRSLPAGVADSLAGLVRSMNCYYSNLIEGHNTHPVEIERALQGHYSQDARARNLQLEAKAHISVQAWIDAGGLREHPASARAVREIHRRFCELLPEELLIAEDPHTGERVRIAPGEIRRLDVLVGRHIAVSPGAVPRFMQRFEDAYAGLGRVETVLAAAAAHHRLLWIHPFLDGNGRVARLMSHAILSQSLESGAIWSVARGLARSVSVYQQRLAACDGPRRNDLDGRGTLSEEALAEFTRFFLEVCIDQTDFMENLVQPERLRARIALWAEEETRIGGLPPQAGAVLQAVVDRGELPRGEAASIVGSGERHARRIVAALMERGALRSESSRAPLRIGFPASLAHRWLPGLFPEHGVNPLR